MPLFVDGQLVWMLPAAGSAKLLVVIAITYLIALADLSHVIAGVAETAIAAAMGEIAPTDALIGFFVPALLGNIIGGVLLVAVLNHAQVRKEV